MAKGKKKLVKSIPLGFGARNIDVELRRAEKRIIEENWVGACEILLPLTQQFPQNKKVWEFLSEASFETGQTQLYQKACMGLLAASPNNDDAAYALGGAYFKNQHPMLAMQTFRRALELNPNHDFAPQVRDLVKSLEPVVQDLLDDFEMSNDEALEITTLHELGQAYLEQGDFAIARATEEEVLQRYPGFSAAYNNLSLIAWLQEDPETAISTAQAVLETEPDNTHALANLVKFQVVSGNAEAARPYGVMLKTAQNDAWDGWTKKIEGLTYLAEDASVVELFEQALDDKMHGSPTNVMFYHWAAVALARTGDKKRAIAQWKKAIKIDPSFSLAQENLDDIQNSIGKQHGAWPFSLEQWMIPKSVRKMRQTVENNLNSAKSGSLTLAFKAFLDDHPDTMSILPIILERGGPQGQEFVLSTAEQLETPELLAMIADFALSQNGSDKMRNRASALAVKHKLLSKESNRMWIEGEWREILVMAYELYSEAVSLHSSEVNALLEEALHLLKTGENNPAKEAEPLLIQALELAPDSPDLLNNLAVAYVNQNREEEGFSIIRDIANRFPNYVFGCAAAAKLFVQEGDLDSAEKLLKPFISRDRFHILEFRAFCDAQIELLVAQKKLDVAGSWLSLLEKVDPQNPQLFFWKKHLGLGRMKFPKLW